MQMTRFNRTVTNYMCMIRQADLFGRVTKISEYKCSVSRAFYSTNSGNPCTEQSPQQIFSGKSFKPESLGIGGLTSEISDVFRRIFASRILSAEFTKTLGIKPVTGLLLHGPPGTGKTLVARQIGKMLSGTEPKIINGPEIVNKYYGVAEERIRKLFKPAQKEQKLRGYESGLHVIIFDEIDSICRKRGENADLDLMCNQLLTMMDGVNEVNNVLVIGTTNRKDLLDEALLRPGRLEVHLELTPPDEHGRLEILLIHTELLRKSSHISEDVNLRELASWTRNYSGAQLAGLVKSAVSFALDTAISRDDLCKEINEANIIVTMKDFERAFYETCPAFGASWNDLQRRRPNGILDCGVRHGETFKRTMLLAQQVRDGTLSPLVTCLLEGPSGSGKTAMTASVGIDSNFPLLKTVSPESMTVLSENMKCTRILEVFEEAYKSPLSMIILDDIERLLEYNESGRRYSNSICQTLLVLLKQLPPKGNKMLVIGCASESAFLNSVGICDAFSVQYHVPSLKTEDARKVLEHLKVFAEHDIDAAAEALNGMTLKKLYMVIDMAAQGEQGGGADAVFNGDQKINLSYFHDCIRQIVRN